jgi:hypothetical protein
MFNVYLGTSYFESDYFSVASPAEFVVVPSEFHYFGVPFFGSEYFRSGLFMQPSFTQLILRPINEDNLNGTPSGWQSTENTIWDAVNEEVLDRDDYIYTTNKSGESNVVRFRFDMSPGPAPGTDLVLRVDVGGTDTRDIWIIIVCDSVVLHNTVYNLSGADETLIITIPYSTWSTVTDWSFFQIQYLGIN